MKINKLTFTFFSFLLLFTFNCKSQDIKQTLNSLKEKIGEVQIDKIVFRQSFDILDEEKGKINYTCVEVDDKGKTKKESFEFYISDVDKNTIIRKTEGKKLFVSVDINNKQKFIKHFKEENLDSYTNNVEILISNADVAQEVIDLIKKAIPLAKTSEKDWASNTDALNWLKSNIGQVTTTSGVCVQTFSFGERKDYLVSLNNKKTDSKGITTEERYDFNILDINKNKLVVKISGAQLSVSLETKGNDKYVKYTKNNEPQSYDNGFEILAQDIDQARNIISAFGSAIAKSKSKMPVFGSLQQAIDFISSNTTDVTLEGKTTKQNIKLTAGQGTKTLFTSVETDSKGKSTEYVSEFYLADLEINSLNFKVSGKKITFLCNTRNKAKFIKYTKDNVIQNYQYDIEVLESDIETTREVIEAYKYAAATSETKPATWNSMGEALDFLKNNIKGETVIKDQYKLSFESNNTEPFNSKYTKSKTDEKGAVTEQTFEFYPYMFESNTTKIESSGKYLTINIGVKGKKSFVKIFKDSKQQSFDNELEIMAFDAKQAKDIAEALKYIANNGKPKDKDWSDKQKAMDFVKENVGNFKGEGKEVKQKLELQNNDPCKVSLTVNTIDDKGKTDEEIFEFSLADINKMMVDYKISGKNVYITMVCKGKQKLVKAYKNGAQQNFCSDVEILEDDVETAKNIADALRSVATQCGE